MNSPKYLDLLINVAGAIVVAFIVGYVGWAAMHTEVEEPCSARYPAASRFSLQTSGGKPLSAIELQARAGLRDLGVIDNASVVQVAGGPSPDALEVKLRKLPTAADPSAEARNGIEFRWAPPGMGKATAACLSYSVWLPDKFAFGEGGFLPGVFGGVSGSKSVTEGISLSPQWDQSGRLLLAASLGSRGIRRMTPSSEALLPTERWVKLEQEIVLNEPGKENGHARLWVDGTLSVDDPSVPLRGDADTLLTGILATVGYHRTQAAPGMLRLSPFEIAWR
ncbi:MAG: polysaccharide lyase [Hyphomicrobium sp.]